MATNLYILDGFVQLEVFLEQGLSVERLITPRECALVRPLSLMSVHVVSVISVGCEALGADFTGVGSFLGVLSNVHLQIAKFRECFATAFLSAILA